MIRAGSQRRLAGLTQLVTPLAVLALVANVVRLTNDARLAERSHRRAAESALRDYAGFASWQFSRQLAGLLRGHLSLSTSPVRLASGPLPDLRVLSERSRACDCGFKSDVVFAFRFDVPSGRLDVDQPLGAEFTNTLAQSLPAAIARIARPLSATASDGWSDTHRDPLRQSSALGFETLSGQTFVIGYSLIVDATSQPRALYGIAAELSHLAEDYRRILATEALLPPSLTARLASDSLLAIRVEHPAVGTVFQTVVAPTPGMPAHTDTLPPWLGGHITTIAIRPEFAGTLLIGGIPPSRLPVQLTLLAVTVALAIVALLQLRRSRELARLRERFVANVSHELRTPLAHISMLSETLMLGRERSVEERRDFATVVFREARRLTTLVESVLQFSRGQSTALRIVPEVRTLAREVSEGIEVFASLARASSVTIERHVPPDLEVRVDPFAFRQVLLNLLDNAVKFGPRGQTVTVAADAEDGMVAVSVTDQGRGIPEADRRRVFDAYARVESPGNTAVSGSGIGLSVVRDLVSAHGGEVRIDTPPSGIGTRVTFTMHPAT